MDSLLKDLQITALKWNGKKRSAFGEFIDKIEAYNKENKNLIHIQMMYFLFAWDPYAILAINSFEVVK